MKQTDVAAADLGATDAQMTAFRAYLEMLEKWQRAINLVGPATLEDAWRRHILDSAQLVRFMPAGRPVIADLGSGAGFPGLVLAILGAGDVHLIESDGRKAAFLAEARRATGAAVTVYHCRIEDYAGPPADVVTARPGGVAKTPRISQIRCETRRNGGLSQGPRLGR